MAESKNPLFDTATTLGKIIAFLGVSVACGALAAGLLVPFTFAAGTGAKGAVQAFDSLPAELKKDAPFQQSKILDREGGEIATIGDTNRKVVPLDQMSPFVIDALIATEDNRFYEHGGVDMQGIASAALSAATGSKVRGASTITQQYVNNVIINQRIQDGVDPENAGYAVRKNIGEKVKEARLAIAVEKDMSKDEILEGYLNLVPFSGQAFGVEAASKYFFNTTAKDLTLPQAAMLAGVINGTGVYNPITNPENAKERRNTVLGRMLTTNKIDQAQYDEAVNAEIELDVQDPKLRCFAAQRAPYFCDYVTKLVLGDPAYGETPDDRRKFLLGGGLVIKTTLDPVAQDSAQDRLNENADPGNTNPEIAAGIVSVQPGSGDITTMAQSTRYDAAEGDGNTQINYLVDRYQNGNPDWPLSESSGFQPGSSFKPYIVAEWLKSGRGLNDTVNGQKVTYPAGTNFNAKCLNGGVYTFGEAWNPQNYEDARYTNSSVLSGLANSLNTATIAEAKQLDMCDIMGTAADMGANQATWNTAEAKPYGEELVDRFTREISPIPPNVLGSGNVSPLGQATGFATIANDGIKCEPRAILEITDLQGRSFPVAEPKCNEAIPKDVAQGVRMAMQQVMTRGSAAGKHSVPVPVAGKTGTSDGAVQTWFVGFSSGLATAVWMGNTVGYNAENIWSDNPAFPIGGRVRYKADGSTTALPIWNAYMMSIYDRYSGNGFENPPQSIMNGSGGRNQQGPTPAPTLDDPPPSQPPAESPSERPTLEGG